MIRTCLLFCSRFISKAIPFGNIQRDRWYGLSPLVTRMPMKSLQWLIDLERIRSVFDRQSVNIESIVLKNLFTDGKFLSMTSTSTITLSTSTELLDPKTNPFAH